MDNTTSLNTTGEVQASTAAETPETKETAQKSFSQAELNAIIADRLKHEREKFSDYESLKEKAAKLDEIEEKNKTELERATEKATRLEEELNGIKKKNEISSIREKVGKELGVDPSLLTMETEEDCRSQAQSLLDWHRANPTSYPSVKDGGEVTQINNVSNRDRFAEWLDTVAK